VRRVAGALCSSGVGHGDRVAFLARNSPEHFVTLFACAWVGAVFVPVNWRLHPDEVVEILEDCGARVLLVADELHADLAAVPAGCRVVRVGGTGPDAYDEWLRAATPNEGGPAAEPDDLALLMYTSGTTGLPKGVMLSHANICGAAANAGVWGLGPDATALVCMPLFHMSGTSWGLVALFRGSGLVLLRDPEPAAVLAAIGGDGVTHALLVPALIAMLLAHPTCATTDFSTLDLVLYGGSPISVELLTAGMERFGCRFRQLYGLTESTGLATALAPEDHVAEGAGERLLRSVGRPSPAVELRVVAPETGRPVPIGQVGEIWLRGDNVMRGYWGNQEATDDTVRDGWLRTGDAAYLDEEGYVFLHDRVKDMIVSGGENVYPAEAERVLRQHPAVADLAVIGVPDERWGETPKAIVVPVPGTAVTEAELLGFVRDRLAHYKCPTSVDLVGDLPRNATGKVLKRALREPYWAGQTRRVN
jgi:long-chain acyl-CoA synthetase